MPRKHETEEDIIDALVAIYRVVYRLGMAIGGRKVTNENYEQVYKALETLQSLLQDDVGPEYEFLLRATDLALERVGHKRPVNWVRWVETIPWGDRDAIGARKFDEFCHSFAPTPKRPTALKEAEIQLDPESSKQVVDLLNNPPKATDALRNALQRKE
jgi:hypothetical protein